MEYTDLKRCGAVGDGVTDDTPALLRAFNVAMSENGTVYVPAGKYAIHPVSMPDGLTVTGNSSWGYSSRGHENNKEKDCRPTDPDFNGNAVFTPLSVSCGALVYMGRGTRISGVSFEGKGLGDSFCCLYSERDDVVLDDVRICHFSGDGAVFENMSGFCVRRSLIIANKGHAVRLINASNGTVTDDQLAYNRGAGFYSDRGGVHCVTITACRIEGGDPGGVLLHDSSFVSVTGNSFDSCGGPAVTLINCTACTATGNMARICGRRHVGDEACQFRIENSRGVSATGNSFWAWFTLTGSDTSKTGMVLRSLTDSIASDNAFFEAATEDVVRDHGGHVNTLINSNTGRVYDLAEFSK